MNVRIEIIGGDTIGDYLTASDTNIEDILGLPVQGILDEEKQIGLADHIFGDIHPQIYKDLADSVSNFGALFNLWDSVIEQEDMKTYSKWIEMISHPLESLRNAYDRIEPEFRDPNDINTAMLSRLGEIIEKIDQGVISLSSYNAIADNDGSAPDGQISLSDFVQYSCRINTHLSTVRLRIRYLWDTVLRYKDHEACSSGNYSIIDYLTLSNSSAEDLLSLPVRPLLNAEKQRRFALNIFDGHPSIYEDMSSGIFNMANLLAIWPSSVRMDSGDSFTQYSEPIALAFGSLNHAYHRIAAEFLEGNGIDTSVQRDLGQTIDRIAKKFLQYAKCTEVTENPRDAHQIGKQEFEKYVGEMLNLVGQASPPVRYFMLVTSRYLPDDHLVRQIGRVK